MKQQLKDWWMQRQVQEKRLLAFGGVVVLLITCYVGWQRAWHYAELSLHDLSRMQQTLKNLPEWEQALASVRSSPRHPDMADLSDSTRAHGLVLRLEQQQACLRLTQSTDVDFPSLLSWFRQAKTEWGISVDTLEMVRKGAKVRITKLEMGCYV